MEDTPFYFSEPAPLTQLLCTPLETLHTVSVLREEGDPQEHSFCTPSPGCQHLSKGLKSSPAGEAGRSNGPQIQRPPREPFPGFLEHQVPPH